MNKMNIGCLLTIIFTGATVIGMDNKEELKRLEKKRNKATLKVIYNMNEEQITICDNLNNKFQTDFDLSSFEIELKQVMNNQKNLYMLNYIKDKMYSELEQKLIFINKTKEDILTHDGVDLLNSYISEKFYENKELTDKDLGSQDNLFKKIKNLNLLASAITDVNKKIAPIIFKQSVDSTVDKAFEAQKK